MIVNASGPKPAVEKENAMKRQSLAFAQQLRALLVFWAACACTASIGVHNGRRSPGIAPSPQPTIHPPVGPSPVTGPQYEPQTCHTLSGWSTLDHLGHSGGQWIKSYPAFAVNSVFYLNLDGDRMLALRTTEDGRPADFFDPGFKHGGIHGFTAVAGTDGAYMFRNGHISRYPFDPLTGMKHDTAEDYDFFESNPETAFGGFKWVWDSAAFAEFSNGNRFFFHLGGWGHTTDPSKYAHFGSVFRGKLPFSPGSAAFTPMPGMTNPEQRPGKAAFYRSPAGDRGFLFVSGEDNQRLHRIEINDQGDPAGGWVAVTPSGLQSSGNGRGDLFTVSKTLFWVRGSQVNAMHLSDAGLPGPVMAMPGLPEEQRPVRDWDGQTEGAAWGVIQGKVYLAGAGKIFWAPLQVVPCP